jgi:uncharacterized membrane protein YgcG
MIKTCFVHNGNKSYCRWMILIAALILFLMTNVVEAAESDWPREIEVPEGKIIIYQPQLETFKDDKLTARAAVSVTKTGASEPVFGAVWFASRVSTDRDTRMVTPLDVKVTNVKFPIDDKAKEEKLAGILEREIPKWDLTFSLDSLLTMLELVEKEKKVDEDFNTKPPEIIFVSHPAVLVSLDGEPELRKIENSDLMRVVNTPFYIAFDPSSKNYYLNGTDGWFVATDIMMSWKSLPKPPASVVEAASSELNDPGKSNAGKNSSDNMPQIIVATTPAELIVTDGEPKYKTITGTELLYVSNTESDVFTQIGTQKNFVLLSGRWFSSPSMDGPWTFVPNDKMPADFAKIPPGSDKGHVLASVAGTEQSNDAVLETYIPQTSAVQRNEEVKVDVEYDGKPEFKKIESTTMTYAVNTPNSVIRVGDTYYLCYEAVWYAATSPTGPWVVSAAVPQVIYTIPPSYPVYNVTYVRVYDTTPTVVYVGYYPGYYGSYVYRGTVVYGTGYYYRGWYGRRYYARPATWGYSVHYNSYGGWGVRVGYPAPGGWYAGGAVWGVGHFARRAYWRNEYEDRRDWRRDRYDDARDFQRDRYDDRRDAQKDRRDSQKDRYSDRRDAQKDRGRDRVDRDGDRRYNAGKKRQDGSRTQYRKTGTDRKRQNNVYSDRNGNAHRKTNQGWQKRNKSGWSKPTRSYSTSGRSNLNRDHSARQRGSQRTKNYQRSRSSSRSSGISRSGGISRGGGGRRR